MPSVKQHIFVQSGVYKIVTLQRGQKYSREHVLTYLGENTVLGGHEFSARPIAGTQTLYDEEIVSTEYIGTSNGESKLHRINTVLR